MDRASAESIALQALTFLASDPRRLGALCAQTGVGPNDLKARIGDPDFLAGVLDFLMSNEAWLIECAEELGFRPESFAKVRAALPGAIHLGST